ncbi:Wzz/FepE/Etk N-terminal domain-containing protein [Novosphingobium aquimarinum]|uniref:Wzz/FepE/Etk N-terminal domain-containing protein n=1 Tax=Novosphingobium aquimarinum TaxID=2682494 RepID=UPI0012EC2EF1|nr:Wzz/FepE/Etk N-terminal domain-containing protein [Novosphingobium aquimarinum]
MPFLYLLKSLLVRKYLIAGCFVLGLVLAAIYLFATSPIYRSTASVVAGVRPPETIGPLSVAEQLSADYLLTQEDILKSDRVAQEVVKTTGLAEDPNIAKFFEWSPEFGPLTDYIAERLRLGLVVEQSTTNSRVMNVSYLSGDPNFSATMANAFAAAFIETNLQLQNDPARRNIESYDRQLQAIATIVIRRGAYTACGGFDPQLRVFEDTDFCMRMASVTKFALIDEPLIYKRYHENSITGGRPDLMAHHAFVAFKAASNQPQLLGLIPRRLAERARKLGNQRFLLNDPRSASDLLALALRLDPLNWRAFGSYLAARYFPKLALRLLGRNGRRRQASLGLTD